MTGNAALVDAVTAALGEIAQSIILPRYKQLGAGDVRAKTHAADLVTIADEESERTLAPILMALAPGSKVVGEEAVAADPGALNGLLRHDPIWIVDPIDGTLNFVNGNPAFATVVALVRQGETVLGWIHDPLTGRTIWAEKGRGAWLRPATGSSTDTRVLLPADFKHPEVDFSTLNASLYNKEFADAKGKFARNFRQGSAASQALNSAACFSRSPIVRGTQPASSMATTLPSASKYSTSRRGSRVRTPGPAWLTPTATRACKFSRDSMRLLFTTASASCWVWLAI